MNAIFIIVKFSKCYHLPAKERWRLSHIYIFANIQILGLCLTENRSNQLKGPDIYGNFHNFVVSNNYIG